MNFQTKKSESYFLSQPHQPFFILAIANAVIMMFIFALDYKGILPLKIGNLTFHVYSLIFLVFTNAFTGFLFTTFPRFNQSETVKKSYYTYIFYANLAGSVLFLIGSLFSSVLIAVSMIIIFISLFLTVLILQSIYKNGISPDKKDSFWIMVAFHLGLLGNLLFILSIFVTDTLQQTAIDISFYLYLIFLAFCVAQRMIPFFSQSIVAKSRNFVKFVFILFIFKCIFAITGLKMAEAFIDTLIGVYMLKEFLRWKLNPFNSPPILWILHLALFWLPLAFFLSAISNIIELIYGIDLYFLNIHLLALGFLTTVLIGFGTRVILGHSGQIPHADKTIVYLFYFTQIIVLSRALYSLDIAFSWNLDFLFDISFTTWLILFIFWAIKYAKVLIFKKGTLG